MTTKYYLDKEFRVGEEGEVPSLLVKRNPDAPDFAMQLTKDGDAENKYWGPIDLSFEPSFARLLAKALIEMADDIEAGA